MADYQIMFPVTRKTPSTPSERKDAFKSRLKEIRAKKEAKDGYSEG